jgi:organic hydroperoxide reductase OsmC/OhrA
LAIYSAIVRWERGGAPFTDLRYSRAHTWSFDGGLTLPASASPHSVRVPFSDPGGIDPEEAFVAALSSCHMLWFMSIAAGRGFVVDSYQDDAIGIMAKDEEGRLAMTEVTLRPVIRFSGSPRPDPGQIAEMHVAAHHECFIANSVRTIVTVAAAEAAI